MNIVYEDKKIMVVRKEAGQLTQSGKSFDLDLTSEILAYRKKRGEQPYIALINRLDRPVSGLVLFAKDKAEAARLSKLLQQGAFCKEYMAIVCGKLNDKEGSFVDYLLKDGSNNTSCVVKEGTVGAKRAELMYEVVKETVSEDKTYTLLKITLLTGRHHQIRVQFASRGLPLLGDVKYGSDKAKSDKSGIKLKRNEIALCAYNLTVDGKTYKTAPDWQ